MALVARPPVLERTNVLALVGESPATPFSVLPGDLVRFPPFR